MWPSWYRRSRICFTSSSVYEVPSRSRMALHFAMESMNPESEQAFRGSDQRAGSGNWAFGVSDQPWGNQTRLQLFQ